MRFALGSRRNFVVVEWLFGVGVVASIIHAYLFLRSDGFLPPPFYFNYDDTLMDGYNTAYWAFQGGIYDVWRSIYPPVSFAWFKLFAMPRCYVGSEAYWRACDWWLVTMLVGFTIGNAVLVWCMYRRHRRATALPRAIAVGFGMPMLFALERGNLIVPAFTFFVLAFGNLLPQARLRWLAAGMAANFKPYLIAAIFAVLLRRRWRWFEGALLGCVLVYLISWIIVGDGSPMQVFRNTVVFADSDRTADWSVAYYPSSYIPLHSFLANSRAPLSRMLGSAPMEFAGWFLPVITRISQLMGVLGAAAIWLRPSLFPATRSIAFAVIIALTAQETGGYAVCFVAFLVFFEEGSGWCVRTALVLCYLLSLCADVVLVQLDVQLGLESYLGGRPVTASYGLTLGTLVRPLMLLMIMNLLSAATLHRLLLTLHGEGRLAIPWRARPSYAAQP